MDFERILFHIKHSATLRLLQSRQASFAMSFFFFAFKFKNRLQIPYSELKELLAEFLENLDDDAKQEYTLLPQQYLDLWSNDTQGFIRKYFELNQDEPMTELTADTERALEWIRGLEKREFVGTQSRFLSIYESMKRIADQTEDNPNSRLMFLKEQRKKLDDEIKEIQATGVVNRMDSTQIRERFLNLIEDSRRLISEFRLVEDIFKEITRKIKEKKLQEAMTKGEILREVLDAHDGLEESDQGRSFSAFWHFLISEDQQNQLRIFSEKILGTPEIREFVRKNPDRQLDTNLLKLKSQHLELAYKAILLSKNQLEDLNPLALEAKKFEVIQSKLDQFQQELQALPYYFATHKKEAIVRQQLNYSQKLTENEAELKIVELKLKSMNEEKLELARLFAQDEVGQQLEKLSLILNQYEEKRNFAQKQGDYYAKLAKILNFPTKPTLKEFSKNLENCKLARSSTETQLIELRNQHYLNKKEKERVFNEIEALVIEVKSLKNRKNRLPMNLIQVRDELVQALGISFRDAPFIAELMKV